MSLTQEQLLIQGSRLFRNNCDVESLHGPLAREPSEPFAKFWLLNKAEDCLAQRNRITHRHQVAISPILNHFSATRRIGCDYRESHRGCLQQHTGDAFSKGGWEYEDIG